MATANQVKRVFISHSPTDKELARDVARKLEAAGLEAVSTEKRVDGAGHLMEILRKAIDESEAVLFLITPAALESEWAFFELGAAEALDKPVVLIGAGVNRKQLAAPFRDYQIVPYDRVEKAIMGLALDLADSDSR